MLSKSSGSSDERTLSRAVQRVKAGTHTPMEAVAAEPSLNAHSGVERESYFRTLRRHVAQLKAEGARRAAAGTAAAYMAAAQKAAATAQPMQSRMPTEHQPPPRGPAPRQRGMGMR